MLRTLFWGYLLSIFVLLAVGLALVLGPWIGFAVNLPSPVVQGITIMAFGVTAFGLLVNFEKNLFKHTTSPLDRNTEDEDLMSRREIVIQTLISAGVLVGVSGFLMWMFQNETTYTQWWAGIVSPLAGAYLVGLAIYLGE